MLKVFNPASKEDKLVLFLDDYFVHMILNLQDCVNVWEPAWIFNCQVLVYVWIFCYTVCHLSCHIWA